MRHKKAIQPRTPTKLTRLVDSNLWTVLSFVAGVSVGFLALTEFRAGPIIAGVAGLGTYFLIAFVIPKRVKRRAFNDDGTLTSIEDPQSASSDPRVELLVDAHQHAATLGAAQAQMPPSIGQSVHVLHRHALAIIDGVSAQPEKLTPVLRFFTYYLPSTADLVMDRIKLAPHAGSARLAEIDTTLTRLVEAFAQFQAAVLAPDLQSVDLDVELLEKALNADLGDQKR